MQNKLAVIIATKDRHDDLRALLESLRQQERKPDQVIIVDSGASPALFAEGYRGLTVDYKRHEKPSLTAQRNAGVMALRADVGIVAFLDDDVVLRADTFRNMMGFWEKAAPTVGGAGLNNTKEKYARPNLLHIIFMVKSFVPGRVLRSGFHGRPFPLNGVTPVQWIPGCAMIFRRNVVDEFRFDEWYGGYARYEDADFTYRVSKKYGLFMLEDAKITHNARLENTDFSRALGYMEIVNRFYFVKKYPELSLPLCVWASSGYMLYNFLRGLLMRDARYALRARGNVQGFIRLIRHGIPAPAV